MPALDTSPEEPIGQLNGIIADKLTRLWEIAAVAYNSISRDDAEDAQLDNIGGLVGNPRQFSTPTVVSSCTLVFSASGAYGAGTLLANLTGQTTVQFTNEFEINVSAPGTVTGQTFIAMTDGPTVVNPNQLSAIAVPTTGWASITNTAAGVPGQNIETDDEYRLRQDQELSAEGSSTFDAIQADVEQVPGVVSAVVQNNDGDVIDANGNPPHSFKVIIWDGPGLAAANNSVAQAIWNDKPSGIPPQGSVTGIATDALGNPRTVPFSRAQQVLMYFAYTVTLKPGVLIASVAPVIKTAVVTYMQANEGLGAELVAIALRSIPLTVPGVLDVPVCSFDSVASPTNTANQIYTQNQIPLADVTRILVNGT